MMPCQLCKGRKKIEGDTDRLTELSYTVLTWHTCPRCQGTGVHPKRYTKTKQRTKFSFSRTLASVFGLRSKILRDRARSTA